MQRIAYDIIAGEQGLVNLDIFSQTLNTTRFRDRDYKEDKVRWELRKLIINELVNMERPANDDEIILGFGGAVPTSGVIPAKQAFVLIGLPASGKSSIANVISDNFNALIVDSDYAKRKLPEFSLYKWGATVVHEESAEIVSGFPNNPNGIESVYNYALSKNYNIVIPKIGQDAYSIVALVKSLRELGYECHLTLVSLLKRESTIRAIHRFYKTKRYVPLGLIFDGYGNDPCLTYHLIRNKASELFKSFGAISTNVPYGDPYISIDQTQGNPAELYNFDENVLI